MGAIFKCGTAITALVIVVSLITVSDGAAPGLINYQGVLQDDLGEPIISPVNVSFTIWNAEVAGDVLWTETRGITPSSNGAFSVLLGAVNPIPDSAFTTDETYLGTKIGADPEIDPRQRLASVPYAISSKQWTASGQVLYFDGNHTLTRQGSFVNGNLGVNLAVIGVTEGGYSAVSGGYGNQAIGVEASTVAGGKYNVSSGQGAAIGGGYNNIASGLGATVSGGIDGEALVDWSTVGGGRANVVDGVYATIAGGDSCTALSSAATVGGGKSNSAYGPYSFVGGGIRNAARDNWTVVCGGSQDSAFGVGSAILGGRDNYTGAHYATVIGGINNRAEGKYSLTAGKNARATHAGSFVWGDTTESAVASSAVNEFTVRASGGVRFYSNGALTTGVTLAAGGGAWAAVSDRSVKENIRPVDGDEVLEKLSRLDISRWNYVTQDESVEHIGPMAQDFYALFGVGDNNTTITTIDPDGISLAAIKALYEENKELRRRLEQLEKLIQDMSLK